MRTSGSAKRAQCNFYRRWGLFVSLSSKIEGLKISVTVRAPLAVPSSATGCGRASLLRNPYCRLSTSLLFSQQTKPQLANENSTNLQVDKQPRKHHQAYQYIFHLVCQELLAVALD